MHLRQTAFNQRLVHPYPKERDEPHWDRYMVVCVVGRTCRSVGDSSQDSKKSDLVGRRFVINEDQVPQERQRANAIVWQSEYGCSPGDAGAP